MTRCAGAFAVSILLVLPSPAGACQCAAVPICEAFWTASLVFSGEVLDVNRVSDTDLRQRVRFRLEQTWRGETSAEMTVMTGMGGGDCGYTFQPGVRYLVYAYLHNGVPWTGICQRTRPLKEAAGDLAYFKTAFAPSEGGRIFGTALHARSDTGWTDRPARGYRVVLSSGERRWRTKTNAEGQYEFRSIPAGKYRLKLEAKESEFVRSMPEVELADARGCAVTGFIVETNNRVALRVVTAKGEAARGIVVQAVEAPPGKPYTVHRTTTDANGDAVLGPLPDGRYLVGVNLRERPTEQHPYAAFYHPGVRDAGDAAVVRTKGGKRRDLGVLKLPPPLAERTLTGVVVFQDGRPAAGASVSVSVHNVVGGPSAADEAGRFSVTLHDGVTYEVRATLSRDRVYWSSRPMTVTATEKLEPLTLILERR